MCALTAHCGNESQRDLDSRRDLDSWGLLRVSRSPAFFWCFLTPQYEPQTLVISLPALWWSNLHITISLRAHDLRAGLDAGDERLNARVRAAAELKIPYILVVGPRDEENQTVSVRVHGIEKDLGAIGLDEFVQAIAREVTDRAHGTAKSTLFPDS